MKKALFLVVICGIFFTLSAKGNTYTVKKGDTFSLICSRFAESGTKAVYEREANRLGISNPRLIYPGQTFSFPCLYRVSWKSLITGYCGHGSWQDMETVLVACESGNIRYKGVITHWPEVKK